jgi:predicted nucleotidyltransferase
LIRDIMVTGACDRHGRHALPAPLRLQVTRQDAIEILLRHKEALRARGVIHAALFGSVAREESSSESDLDVLIELDPNLKLDVFAYAGIQRFVAELFNGPVDVVDKDALKPDVRPSATADAIYAF